jgi:hypothetical protein
LNSADEVMQEVKRHRIEHVAAENRRPDLEVEEVASMFSNVFLVFDSVFSLARMPVGLLTPEKEEKATQSLSTAMKLWRELDLPHTPKIHVLEDHFLFQLSSYKGLGDYSEDFVEQAHQIGIREESRTLAIRDRSCAAELHCKREHKRSLPRYKISNCWFKIIHHANGRVQE